MSAYSSSSFESSSVSKLVPAVAVLAVLTKDLCTAAVGFSSVNLVKQLGELPSWVNYLLAGTPIALIVAIFLTYLWVENLGFQKTLYLGSAGLLAVLLVELSLTLLFQIGGMTLVIPHLIVCRYLSVAAGGVCETVGYLLLANYLSKDHSHIWGRIVAATSIAYFIGNVSSDWTDEGSLLPLLIAATSVVSLGFCVWRMGDVIPSTQDSSSNIRDLFKPTVLFPLAGLVLLGAITLELSRFNAGAAFEYQLGESLGYEMLSRNLYIGLLVFAGVAWFAGYLKRYVTDYDLLIGGAVCFLAGTLRIAVANTEVDYARAWLFVVIGGALSQPAVLSMLQNRFRSGPNLYFCLYLVAITAFDFLLNLLQWFSLGNEVLTAETGTIILKHRSWALAVWAGALLVIFLVVIFWRREGICYRFLIGMHWPKNRTLANVLGWSMFGVMTSLAAPPSPENLEQMIGQFFLSFVYGYVFGPFWSSLWFVSAIANVLAIYISSVIIMKRTAEIDLARSAFTILFVLSMFTIWVEPWLTLTGIALNVITAYFKTSILLFIDIGATIGWLWALSKVHKRLGELGQKG